MRLRLALGQIGPRVGDIEGNIARIIDAWRAAADAGADLVVFPELAVTGYPPEDLLLKDDFLDANLRALETLASSGPVSTVAVVGYVSIAESDSDDADEPGHNNGALGSRALTNAAAVFGDGRIAADYDKGRLPNYGVFDEARYFSARDEPCLVSVAGVRVGVTICADLWTEHGPARAAVAAGAQVIANVNASPYHQGKAADREYWVRHHAVSGNAYVAYCNVVGGQDEVVFDGDSMLAAPDGTILARGAQFTEDLIIHDVEVAPASVSDGDTKPRPTVAEIVLPGASRDKPALAPRQLPARLDPVGEVWHALVRATGDYCRYNGFTTALVGLSGGIDSAVTAAIAIDALGAEQVTTVAMPSPYSSQHSLDDAAAMAKITGCPYHEVPIGGALEAATAALGDHVVTGFDRDDGRQPSVAYENLQSRLRGLLLMALSNEHGSVVLTTGNKSEYAVGYATLYGDMSGGFAPLKDVPKLLVYELARWRNRDEEMIPTATIDKPPSAELRPGQLDQDSLPDYEILDDIIAAYIEHDNSIDQIVARGHDPAQVRHIVHLINRAEYKRRQAAPGPKITSRAFGRERRAPITNLWRG